MADPERPYSLKAALAANRPAWAAQRSAAYEASVVREICRIAGVPGAVAALQQRLHERSGHTQLTLEFLSQEARLPLTLRVGHTLGLRNLSLSQFLSRFDKLPICDDLAALRGERPDELLIGVVFAMGDVKLTGSRFMALHTAGWPLEWSAAVRLLLPVRLQRGQPPEICVLEPLRTLFHNGLDQVVQQCLRTALQ